MMDFTLDHGSDGAGLKLSGERAIESARKVRVIVPEATEGVGVLSLGLSTLDRADAAGLPGGKTHG